MFLVAQSHVFLFFDIEEFRQLKVQEDLKKKLSRKEREAREAARAQDISKLLTTLFEMVAFFSEKIVPKIESSETTFSLRLELCLWREVQYHAYQFSKVFSRDPALPLMVTAATVQCLEVAKRHLRLHDIAFSEMTLRDTGNGGIEADFAVLSIVPSDDSIPGRVAKRLSEKGQQPVLLCYSPAYTGAQGWAGKLTEKALYVSCDFILSLDIDPDTGHELCHWESARRLFEGALSPFHGDVLRGGQRSLPPSVGPYDGGLEFDELEAYGYNMLVAGERLLKSRTPSHRVSEAFWLRLEAQTGMGIAKAITEILSEALLTLERVFQKVGVDRITFTADRRSNSDGRPAKWFGIGTMEQHFGFQLTDFGKSGTDYVRAVVFSSGWIIGCPILGRDVIERATTAKELHQQGGQSNLWNRMFGKKKDETDFFRFLEGEIRKRFTEQKKLAEKFEADFSQSATAISAFLENQTEDALEGVKRMADIFSSYPICRPEAGIRKEGGEQ